MTTNDFTIDPALYQLFEQIVREAPPATEYRVNMTGSRPDGTTYRYQKYFTAAEKNQLPWGVLDTIIEATWWAPDEFGVPRKEFLTIHVSTHHNAVGFITSILDMGSNIVCVNHNGPARSYPLPDRTMKHIVGNDDDAIKLMLSYIAWINDRSKGASAGASWDDDYDDRSRYDPLDERNYPLHER